MINYTLITYGIYILLSLGLTYKVGHTLYVNGRRFLMDILAKDEELVNSLNHLLIVGFYLINIGYATFTLKIYGSIINFTEMIEELSVKVGLIILILGAMHFFNLMVLLRLRKRKLYPTQRRPMITPIAEV